MLISRSGVSSSIIHGLSVAIEAGDVPLCLSLLSTILSFSFTASNCEQLASGGIVSCLPSLLSVGYQQEMTSLTVDLLWNLLENAPDALRLVISDSANESQDPETPPISSQLAVSLSLLFRDVLGLGFREVDKELRNNVLVVLSLLLDSTSTEGRAASTAFASACHNAGLFDAALAVACMSEAGGDGSPYVKPWALTTEELDLEAKLLSWSVLVSGGTLLQGPLLDAIDNGGLVQTLLVYVSAALPLPLCIERWNSDRRATLRTSALASLHKLAPLLPLRYIESEGPDVVLTVISSAISSSSSSGSYVPVTGSQVEAALRHLTALCDLRGSEVSEPLGTAGSIPIILELIKKWKHGSLTQSHGSRLQGTMAGGPLSPEDGPGQKTCALMLLASLCAPSPPGLTPSDNLRRLRKAEGIAVILQEAELLQQLDPSLPSQLALACFSAIWSCVIPDRKNAARFLVAEGIDHILDSLEHGHPSHRPLILSLLSDLLENPRALPFFHVWRSGLDQQPAAHLLIRFWKEEENSRGLTLDGVLTNTTLPLKGLDKRTRWIAPEAIAYGNTLPSKRAQMQAVSEACSSEQLLAKIYSVLKIAGIDNIAKYVSLEDQATLCLIEKYVRFKQGEVWRQIKQELEEEGVRPTAPDRLRLASGIELSEALAESVKEAQRQILDQHIGAIRDQETKFFEDQLGQKTYEKEMRFFGLAKDASRLTLGEIRDAKAKKADMLSKSLLAATALSSSELEASLRDVEVVV